jgi:uncharacterized protein YjiS (DUF1127 family)
MEVFLPGSSRKETDMPRLMRQAQTIPSSVALFNGKAPRLEQPQVLRKLMQMMERAHQRKALSELEIHQLEDIGITQAELRREVGKRFWE